MLLCVDIRTVTVRLIRAPRGVLRAFAYFLSNGRLEDKSIGGLSYLIFSYFSWERYDCCLD